MQTGKIRLYRGPLDGKVLKDSPYFGSSHIVMHYTPRYKRGSKKWYEHRSAQWDNFNTGIISPMDYRRVIYRRTNYMHPDGSIFYEWDQPRKS